MAADSVGNTNLQDGSVSNEKLEDGSITNEKLTENSITKDKLKDNTIGIEKLDPELRQTINAATGLPENLVETIQNIDDTLKDHQSQLDDKYSHRLMISSSKSPPTMKTFHCCRLAVLRWKKPSSL